MVVGCCLFWSFVILPWVVWFIYVRELFMLLSVGVVIIILGVGCGGGRLVFGVLCGWVGVVGH